MASRDVWLPLSSFKCPVNGCPGSLSPKNWVCEKDNTDMFISQNGTLSCGAGHIGRIIDWKFDCGSHGDHSVRRWQTPDLQGFTFALSHATQLTCSAGATWFSSLVVHLGSQYENNRSTYILQ
ncbi:uncharacterized protein LOC127723798 [Mytilus californianus]|uniref:uncharacterized protein LOC127723798 n=1 Tax=Mytilus californianus TaxID=6549 RepID=UPI002247549B|nr:uncharacterized protein LOC127723798 [Mytilus californianus]